MFNSGQLLFVLSIVGVAYVMSLNLIILSLTVICGMLIHEKWVKSGTGKGNFISRSDQELHKKIAIAATLAAIKIDNDTMQPNYSLPATALVSAWQAVMRSNILKRHRTLR